MTTGDVLTVGSLFSGIGGIELGLERAGMVVKWQCEVDPYASRVLAKHWPAVPNLGDITQVDFTQVEPVGVLAGGFPCQGISDAGLKLGLEDGRSGLWREYARAIGEIRPRYVFVENVRALLVRGFGTVLGDLAALGYDAEWDCIPAASVGAPHLRDRLFLVAYAHGAGSHQQARILVLRGAGLSDVDGRGRSGSGPRREDVADRHRTGLEGRRARLVFPPAGRQAAARLRYDAAGLRGSWWTTEPDVGRVADGVPSRVDRLRGLGNAVVPQIPELIGGWIIEHARATGYLRECA